MTWHNARVCRELRRVNRRRSLTSALVEIVHDGLLQFIDAFENTTADALSRDFGKEALDHVLLVSD
jgi:hypothetical protein